MANLNISGTTLVACLFVASLLLSTSHCEDTQQSIVFLDSQSNIDLVMFNQQSKPALIIILPEEEDRKGQAYEVLEQYCRRNQNILNCGAIIPQNQAYKGSHEFFRVQDTNSTVIGFIKDSMRLAYVYQGSYRQLSESRLQEFVSQAMEGRGNKVVDDRIPESMQIKSVQILTKQTFEKIVQENHYAFILFFHPEDDGCKQFAARFDSLAAQLSQLPTNVAIGAIDCLEFNDACTDRIVKYYPTLRLYIGGHSVQFPKQVKIPQVAALYNFISKRIEIRPTQIQTIEQVPSKPAIVFFGPEISKHIEILPQVYDKYPVFFITEEREGLRLQFHIEDKVIQYSGILNIRQIQSWVETEIGLPLSNLLEEEPDSQIISAVKNRKPIIFLLDVQKDKSEQYRAVLSHIAKELSFCAGYAQRNHPAFQSFLDWVHLSPNDLEQHSKIVYSQTITDKKYLFPHPLEDLNKQSMEEFISDIRNNQIEQIKEGQKKANPVTEEQL